MDRGETEREGKEAGETQRTCAFLDIGSALFSFLVLDFDYPKKDTAP